MATMNVSLPEEMKSWAEAQTEHGRYGNVSDYVRDLIRRDRERAASIAEFQSLINEGLESGISQLTMDDVWQQAMALAESTKPA